VSKPLLLLSKSKEGSLKKFKEIPEPPKVKKQKVVEEAKFKSPIKLVSKPKKLISLSPIKKEIPSAHPVPYKGSVIQVITKKTTQSPRKPTQITPVKRIKTF